MGERILVEDEWFKDAHGTIMTVAWFGLENIALWSLFFKQYRYAIYVHVFCMSSIAFLTSVAAMGIIGNEGPEVITEEVIHMTLGFVVFVIMPAIILSGSFCIFGQHSPTTEPFKVYFGNKAHSIFGWAVIILAKFPLFSGWQGEDGNVLFIVFIVVDMVSYSVYLLLKFFRPTMGKISINDSFTQVGLRGIKAGKDLKIYSSNYFIFADYVYNLAPIEGIHPGGCKIIANVRTRQVDRFIYGMEPLEMFDDVPTVSHTTQSLNLAGPPIAKLENVSPYPVLEQLNEAQVANVMNHDKHRRIYTVYLKFHSLSLSYIGYCSLSQFGQYYAVTVDRKLTRLYTAVNFLRKSNIALMGQISGGKAIPSDTNETMRTNSEMNESSSKRTLSVDDGLPLLIKKYEKGSLTSKFLVPNFDGRVVISRPRGRGLSLHDMNPGNIIMLAGGTGLYPFCDTIDILFKEMIYEQGHSLSNSIKSFDSIVGQGAFKKFKFSLYLAVNEYDELHPITLYQCNELTKAGRLTCVAKMKQFNKEEFSKKYEHIRVISERFESVVSKQASSEQLSQFYVCGPTSFSKALIEQFSRLGLDGEQFRIL